MSFKILVFFGVWLIGSGCVLADNDRCSYGSTSCESNHICCNNQCVYDTDCSGRMCNVYSGSNQCSGIQCCDGVCQYSCDYSPVPLIIGIVFGMCFLIFILTIIIFCIYRRRRSSPSGGYIVTHPQGQVHTTTYTSYPTGHPYVQQGYGQANPQYGYGAI